MTTMAPVGDRRREERRGRHGLAGIVGGQIGRQQRDQGTQGRLTTALRKIDARRIGWPGERRTDRQRCQPHADQNQHELRMQGDLPSSSSLCFRRRWRPHFGDRLDTTNRWASRDCPRSMMRNCDLAAVMWGCPRRSSTGAMRRESGKNSPIRAICAPRARPDQ